MNTIEYQSSEVRTAFDQSESVVATQQERFTVRSGSETISGANTSTGTRRFVPTRKVSKATAARPAVRTKRRLRGFLVELSIQAGGNEARVAFVENNQTILYDLPAEQIQKAGITVPNQPFEMDEVEMQDEDGAMILGYRFKALAKPSDAHIQTLNFDTERKRKRDLILREFSQTQD